MIEDKDYRIGWTWGLFDHVVTPVRYATFSVLGANGGAMKVKAIIEGIKGFSGLEENIHLTTVTANLEKLSKMGLVAQMRRLWMVSDLGSSRYAELVKFNKAVLSGEVNLGETVRRIMGDAPRKTLDLVAETLAQPLKTHNGSEPPASRPQVRLLF